MHTGANSPQSRIMMERILLGVLCLSGCLTFSSCLDRHYHYVSEAKNWTEAQSYCREKFTDLATAENSGNMTQVINTGPAAEVWIGLYSLIDWRWSDGFNGTGAEYRNFHPLEPNFINGDQFCVGIGSHGYIYDTSCSTKLAFICYKGTMPNTKFRVVTTKKSWSSAQSYCRQHFTDLAVVRNKAETDEITSLMKAKGVHDAWIGLFRDPNLFWSDGSSYSFGFWSLLIPLGSMRDVCGVADLSSAGKWNLTSCDRRLPFVCYSIKTSGMMVKLRLKVQDSSVDLNDPAIQEQILKQLQDQVGSNVTLNFVDQPNGEVFTKEEESSDKEPKHEL